MIYITYLNISGEFGHNTNIKIAHFKSKCNSHDHKWQYLKGSDKKLLSEHHFYRLCYVISHTTIRGKKAYRKITSKVYSKPQMTPRNIRHIPFWEKKHNEIETILDEIKVLQNTCDITFGRD